MSKISKTTTKTTKKATKVPSDDENEQISEPEQTQETIPKTEKVDNIAKLVEDVKQAQIKERVTPDNYTFRFGKYKQMLAKDIIKLQKENKLGQMEPVGLKYIMWLINEATWLNSFDRNILTKIVDKNT